MTRRYVDWWLAGRANFGGQNKIILKFSKRGDIPVSSKVHHSQLQDRKKSSSSVKSKANLKDSSQVSKLSTKSATPKGMLVRAGKRDKPFPSTLKMTTTPDNTCKRKDPPTSFENNDGQASTKALCKDKTSTPILVGEVTNISSGANIQQKVMLIKTVIGSDRRRR